MKHMIVRNVLFILFTLGLIAASLTGLHFVLVHATIQQRMTLNTQIAPQVQQARFLHATDTQQQLQLSIGLQLRDKNGAEQFLRQVADPQSPAYQHYLTPGEFKRRFAPTTEQVEQVVSYLQSQGLTVTDVASNHLLIDVTGTVGQIQQSFQVQINTYQLQDHVFYANAAPPSLPASIAPLIASINGLDNSSAYHPLYHVLPAQSQKVTMSFSSPPGFSGNDLASAYDVTPLHNAGILGQNQTVALFELDGYQQDDITHYFQHAGLATPQITNIAVDNVSGGAGQGAVETTLDIEMLGAIAPQANILVYEGPGTIQGMNDTYTKIVSDDKAALVSMSWGLCESSIGNAELQTLDTIFKQGAMEGISFIAAAGDAGAYDCQSNALAVDSPADDPYVTGVGATTLQLNNGAYGSETVWSNAAQTLHGPHGSGSGGGLSTFFPLPAWQNDPSIHTAYSNGNRQVPDIAAFGDTTVGFSVYCTVTNAGCPKDGWMKIGGTSVAAPFWAGGLLLIRQYMRMSGRDPFGLVNPTLYKLFTNAQPYPAFHDITSGNNLYYPATAGYDLASGMGSPDLYNIARDLAPGSAIVVPPTPTQMQGPLIQNGSFENGSTAWQESSGMGAEIVDPSNPHSGQNSAFLCGYTGCNDRIWQTFTVPTSFTSIQLSYWWYASSSTTQQCLDTFASQLQSSDGTVISTLQQSCNSNATGNWQQKVFDLSAALNPYQGKTVTLLFRGSTAQQQSSSFFVDDVTITTT